MDFRYFCLNAHYRKKLNFTFDGMDGAKVSYARLLGALYQHKTSAAKTDEDKIKAYKDEFVEAINDDLNVPRALGILWKAVKEPKSRDIYDLALDFDKVFGLSLDQAKPEEQPKTDAPAEVVELAEKRVAAKKEKNYSLADELRAQITAAGYTVTDTKDGYVLNKT